MSFITRCPACDTAFKVVSDQLKISDGWVRCGQCQHVFDATLDLQPWWPGAELVDLDVPPAGQAAASAAVATEPDQPAAPSAEDVQSGTDRAVDVPADAESDASWHSPMYVEEMAGYTPPPTPDASSAMSDWPDMSATDAPEVSVPPELASELTFMQQAQRKAFWRRPAVRAALASAAVCLCFLLGVQWSLLKRDVLATQWPPVQPVLETLCQPLGCQVHAGQRLEQFSIDSSALLRRAPDRFAFDMVLKNAADQALMPPSLELTLTDAQDKVVARRVFAPSDWPQTPPVMPARAEHPVRLELALDALADQTVVGYRAILFYP